VSAPTRRRASRLLGGLAAVALVASSGGDAPAQGEDSGLRRVDLEVGGRITEVLPADLDGDGRPDLFVVRGREGLIFFQGDDGSWPSRPNQRFRLHPRTLLFDLADVTGDGRAEVVLLMADGVYVYRLRARRGGRLLYGLRPERLVEIDSFLARPVADEVRRKELVRDLDGDGAADLVLPRRDGFSVLRGLGGGELADPLVLPAPPVARLHPGSDRVSSRLRASYWFANPVLAQWDAEGGPELLLAQEGSLAVYAARGGPLPLHREASYTLPDQRRFSFTVENPFELDFTMPLVLRDLDGDGRTDVSSTHVGQGTTRVFLNRGQPAEDLATPAQSIRAKGVTLISFYTDLDGDGLLDLVLPRIDEIGVWSILKVLVTRSVPVEVLFYYQRAEGGPAFPSEPDLVREIEIPVVFGNQGERFALGTTITANMGDFDGDGRRDLLHRTEDDRVDVYRGLPGRRIDEDPSISGAIRDVEPYRFCLADVAELTGDARSDVILRYVSWDREGDQLTLLLAR